MKNNLYVVIAAGELITLLWARTRFNQPDWLNCFSSFHAACVKENLHSESESGLELTARAPHHWQSVSNAKVRSHKNSCSFKIKFVPLK